MAESSRQRCSWSSIAFVCDSSDRHASPVNAFPHPTKNYRSQAMTSALNQCHCHSVVLASDALVSGRVDHVIVSENGDRDCAVGDGRSLTWSVGRIGDSSCCFVRLSLTHFSLESLLLVPVLVRCRILCNIIEIFASIIIKVVMIKIQLYNVQSYYKCVSLLTLVSLNRFAWNLSLLLLLLSSHSAGCHDDVTHPPALCQHACAQLSRVLLLYDCVCVCVCPQQGSTTT